MAPSLSTNLFERFAQEMRIRQFQPSTIAAYTSMLRAFVGWLGGEPPRAVETNVVRRYLLDLIDEGYSRATIDQAISALKFLYVDLYGRDPAQFALPRPRREQRLPYAPSRDEILRMAEHTDNNKHRLMILLLYASGIRVAELVNLHVGDLDLERLRLLVRAGKGKKDRYTVLSGTIAPVLRARMGDRNPQEPLFLGQDGGNYAVRSVQHVVRRAGARAGLTKRVHPHCLRHSFATHLLENGADLLVVRILLGHASTRTTARYIHLQDSNKLLRSPL